VNGGGLFQPQQAEGLQQARRAQRIDRTSEAALLLNEGEGFHAQPLTAPHFVNGHPPQDDRQVGHLLIRHAQLASISGLAPSPTGVDGQLGIQKNFRGADEKIH
jgi:hypothetical protein